MYIMSSGQQKLLSSLPHTYRCFLNEEEVASKNSTDSSENKITKELNNIKNKNNIIYRSQLNDYWFAKELNYLDYECREYLKYKLNDKDIIKIEYIIKKIKKLYPNFEFNNEISLRRSIGEDDFSLIIMFNEHSDYSISKHKIIKLLKKDTTLIEKINLYLRLKSNKNFREAYLKIVDDNKYEDLSYYYQIIK